MPTRRLGMTVYILQTLSNSSVFREHLKSQWPHSVVTAPQLTRPASVAQVTETQCELTGDAIGRARVQFPGSAGRFCVRIPFLGYGIVEFNVPLDTV